MRVMPAGRLALGATVALLLGALPLVAGHGERDMSMSDGMNDTNATLAELEDEWADYHRPWEPSYFRDGGHGAWLMAHIVLMVLAWVMAMPVALMLSVARSRYHLPLQVAFHTFNGLGVFTGFVYNHATPDLYKNNAHHPIGWVVTSLTIVWTLMSFYTAYGEYRSRRIGYKPNRAMPSANMAQYSQLDQYNDQEAPRWSRDSAMGSSRQNSSESVLPKPEDAESPEDDEDETSEQRGFLGNNRVDRFVSKYARRFSTPSAAVAVRGAQVVLEKLLLLLGFVAISTGFVVYGGIARHKQAFSIAAHFVKGGIFFWYGVLTLGRWMGAFGEFGWAWNIRPTHPSVARWKTRIPSAEFVESFVIWLYGSSNVFLEHLNNWGGEWSPQDFEHVSITILFFGGGLLGMLLESKWVRDQMNTSVVVQKSRDEVLAGSSRTAAGGAEAASEPIWQEPERLSLNPMPALTILVLGAMMAAHHQDSMVSTMMHAQWGGLFFAFALARATTYVIMYLKPPTSHFPSRPPSELVAAFCLVSGGLMFMMSGHDTVGAIEGNGLDAMTIYTITMGVTGVVMAWEVTCFAIKGWAVRKERAAASKATI